MALFEDKAPGIMAGLMRDVGVTDYQAAGILGNIGWECAGFEHLSQIHGTARGWVQWDGSRKTAFLTWCSKNGLDWMSDEANYRYLVLELKGSEASSLKMVKATTTAGDASDTFEHYFERAGVPALAGRRQYTQRAMIAYMTSEKKPVAFPLPQTNDQPPPTGLPPGEPPLKPPPAGDGLGEPDQTEQPPSGGFLMTVAVIGILIFVAFLILTLKGH